MKKVLMVAAIPAIIGQYNIKNIEILQELGAQVEVACNFNDETIWKKEKNDELKNMLSNVLGVKCHQVDFVRNAKMVWTHKKPYKQIEKIIKENNYDVLHCMTPIASVVTRAAARKTKVKIIYTAYGFKFYENDAEASWATYNRVERKYNKKTDTIIAINRDDYDVIKDTSKAKYVEYVPGLGVDIEKINAVKIDWEAKRRSLSVKDDELIFLSVGELTENKNHRIVIEVLSTLTDELKFKYFICGEGPLEAELKELIHNKGLDNKVIMLGYRDDIYELCKVSDLFIFPSKREGLALALMEAVAAYVPVICGQIKSNKDLISDRRFFFEPRSSMDIRKTILRAIDMSNEDYKMTLRQNFENVKKCDIKIIDEKMTEIYKRTLED